MAKNGSDGISLDGRTVEYATELWLAGPSAFWLHPEGPLSDTTPDEYLEKQAQQERAAREAQTNNPYANAYAAGLCQSSYFMQAGLSRALGLHGMDRQCCGGPLWP